MTDQPQRVGLEIRRHQDAATVVLELHGRLGFETTAVLESELSGPLSDGFRHIVVDLSQLGSIDRRGLGALMEAQNAARAEHKAFSLRRGSRQVQRLFELTGLTRQFTFEG